jgi:hypothetical protein
MKLTNLRKGLTQKKLRKDQRKRNALKSKVKKPVSRPSQKQRRAQVTVPSSSLTISRTPLGLVWQQKISKTKSITKPKYFDVMLMNTLFS